MLLINDFYYNLGKPAVIHDWKQLISSACAALKTQRLRHSLIGRISEYILVVDSLNLLGKVDCQLIHQAHKRVHVLKIFIFSYFLQCWQISLN